MHSSTKFDWSLAFLVLVPCAILTLVALTAVVTVLISSRHSFEAWRKFKAALAVLLWVVPAASIVFVIGMKSARSVVVVPPDSGSPVHQHSAAGPFLQRVRNAERAPQLAAGKVAPQARSVREATILPVNEIERAAHEAHAHAENAAHSADSHSSESHHEIISSHGVATAIKPSAAVSSRLKVRELSSEEPNWTTASNVVDHRELIPVSSGRFATLADAEDEVTQMALARVRELLYYEANVGLSDADADQRRQSWIAHGEIPIKLHEGIESWRSVDLPKLVKLIDLHAVKDLVGEVMVWDFKNGTKSKMYRAHLRLDFSPAFLDSVRVEARADLVRHRIMSLGGMLGLVTLMLGTAAGYFKLDDATAGAYRRRLKLAAVALIAAGGLATARLLGS